MLERISYRPKHESSTEAAKAYMPSFIYADPDEANPIHIREDFYGSRRKLRIGILGAGITTINFLHYLEESIPAETVEVVVFEKKEDVGGVWLTTRYPGCRNDMPGVTYQFSWRPNIWPEWLPSAADYGEYVKTVAKERDFYRYIRFRQEILQASWTDEEAKWTLKVRDLASDRVSDEKFDLFLEFHGPVSSPVLNLEGLDRFEGQVVHTANWPKNLDLKNKRVALLGCGSTGVQIAPNIINDVSKLLVWFRSKTYVLPPLAQEFAAAEGYNFKYTEEQKKLLASDPDVYLAYCKAIDSLLYNTFSSNLNGTPSSIKTTEAVLSFMKHKLASKPEIFSMLKPDNFDVKCRRPTMSHGYLETLVHPKTTVLPAPPQSFTPKGILDSTGTEHEIDIFIAATGYDHTHTPRYPHLVNGIDISTLWTQHISPPAYMGLCWLAMPNYFNPGAAYANAYGSWHHVAEVMSKYIIHFLHKLQLQKITTFTPKPLAIEHFVKHSNTFMQRFVQAGPCNAWYKTKEGRPTLWPGNKSHFMKVLERPRFEDFDLGYEDEGDMFSYMGNGFALDPDGVEGGDVTWYLGRPGRKVGESVLEELKGVHGEVMVPPVLNAEVREKLDSEEKREAKAVL